MCILTYSSREGSSLALNYSTKPTGFSNIGSILSFTFSGILLFACLVTGVTGLICCKYYHSGKKLSALPFNYSFVDYEVQKHEIKCDMVCLSFHDFEIEFVYVLSTILVQHYALVIFVFSFLWLRVSAVSTSTAVVSSWLLILVPAVAIQSKLYINSNSAVTIRSHELKFLWPKILSLLVPCTSVNSDVVHFSNSDIDLALCSNDPLLHSISGHLLLQTNQVDMLIN